MTFRRKLITLAILLTTLCGYILLQGYVTNFVSVYNRVFYYPWQSMRNSLFAIIPFSFGDVGYVSGGVWLLATIIRWGYYIVHFRTYKLRLAASALTAINTGLVVYLMFFLGWGANYNKLALHQYWKLNDINDKIAMEDSIAGQQLHAHPNPKYNMLTPLIDFNYFLIARLNTYASGYHPLSIKTINYKAQQYYQTYTDCPIAKNGLHIKPSVFGNFLERMAVEGYYNPFTGEGQVNERLPGYIMPFLICHEMAHQAGIAAEEDANLMAYALGTTTTDSVFRYSAYLNLWQYANNRLYRYDTGLANRLERTLKPLTISHLDTLEQIYKQYHKTMAHYSSEMYDSYLKLNDQQDGIISYSNVAKSARLLEKSRLIHQIKLINLP